MTTSFGSLASDGSGTLTLTRPAVASGQLLTAILFGLFSDAVITPPAGWTAVGNTGAGNNDQPSFFVYTKIAGGSESSTYAFTLAPGANGQRQVTGLIGVTTDPNTSTPVNVTGTVTRNFGSSTANITVAGVTTTAPTLLIALVGDGANTYSQHTFTPPAGFTEVAETYNPGWSGGAFAVFTKEQPAAGATGSFTAVRSASYFGNLSWLLAIEVAPSADATPPSLSSPTGTATGTTTASGTVSTNEGNGTLYRLASTSASVSAATVKAAALTQVVSATGVQNVSFSGLAASTAYYPHYVHRDAAGNDSAVATGASFTTSAAGDTTAPTLSSPTGTQTGSSTASGTVSTNEGNGTLYRLASTSSSVSAATVKAAALTQAVSATGVQNVTFSGLAALTGHYAHYVHRDAAGNDSAVATSPLFTTAAAADPTPPTLTGSITVGAVTSTSIAISWPAGSDNVAVTGYQVSSDGGGSWQFPGNVLTHTFTGLSPSTSYDLRVRAADATGHTSTPPLSATQSTSAATPAPPSPPPPPPPPSPPAVASATSRVGVTQDGKLVILFPL